MASILKCPNIKCGSIRTNLAPNRYPVKYPWAVGKTCLSCHCYWTICGDDCCKSLNRCKPLTTMADMKSHHRNHTSYKSDSVSNALSTDGKTMKGLPLNTFVQCHAFYNALENNEMDTKQTMKYLMLKAMHQNNTVTLQSSPISEETLAAFLWITHVAFALHESDRCILANLLQLFYSRVLQVEPDWNILPITMIGFKKHLLNTTNTNAFCSLLPKPSIEMDDQDVHAYIHIYEALNNILLLKGIVPAVQVSQKWLRVCQCPKFQTELQTAYAVLSHQTSMLRLFVGLIIWSDGWDPCQSGKMNRASQWTLTMTYVFFDMDKAAFVGICTFPISAGPGKKNHSNICQYVCDDINKMQQQCCSFAYFSQAHGQKCCVYPALLVFIQDQPERRSWCHLKYGNSSYHAVFGISCRFDALVKPPQACSDCICKIQTYLITEDWSSPVQCNCDKCHHWSLDDICKTGAYKTPVLVHESLQNAPHGHILNGPGRLSHDILKAVWNFAVQQYAIDESWTDTMFKTYCNTYCFYGDTYVQLKAQCNRIQLLHQAQNTGNTSMPHFTQAQQTKIIIDADKHPLKYQIPPPPAAWSFGGLEDHIETIMHLCMGIQKALFQFVFTWSSQYENGEHLITMLSYHLRQIKNLRLNNVPAQPYKTNKMGGYIATSFRVHMLLGPWMYRQINNDITAEAKEKEQAAAHIPQAKWNKKQNEAWLRTKGISFKKKITAKDAKRLVETHIKKQKYQSVEAISAEHHIDATEIKELIWVAYKMFATLFAYDLWAQEGHNRAQAHIMLFLSKYERVEKRMNPDETKPEWIGKYNFLSLLRCVDSFLTYGSPRNLHEGGFIGEGMVKVMRRSCPPFVNQHWGSLLLRNHSIRHSLECFDKELQVHGVNTKTTHKFCESGNIHLYTSLMEIRTVVDKSLPLSIAVYGYSNRFIFGVVIRKLGKWYLHLIKLGNANHIQDKFGFLYHQLIFNDNTPGIVLGDSEMSTHVMELPFYCFALLLPYIDNLRNHQKTQITNCLNIDTHLYNHRYAIVNVEWMMVNNKGKWSYPNW